jgi:hypothetical protein
MTQNLQMDVLYMQSLGQVVGIFTRMAEPSQIEIDASAFVGEGLAIGIPDGGSIVSLTIPPALIGLFRTGRSWRQIFQPSTLYISGLPNAPAVESFSGQTLTVTFSSPNLKIAPAPATQGDILVLVQPTAGGTTVQFNTSIMATQPFALLPMTGLVSGQTYNAFVFLSGFPISLTASFIAP